MATVRCFSLKANINAYRCREANEFRVSRFELGGELETHNAKLDTDLRPQRYRRNTRQAADERARLA